jgi:tetratricopeptide (TPR) repeat protein
MRVATVALAVAAVGAATLFMFLPSPTARNVDTSTPAPARPVVQPPAMPEAAPSEQPDVAAATLQRELAAGADALSAIKPAVARAAFERALLRDPGNATARAGIAASEKLNRVLDAWSAAMRAETAGEMLAAKSSYESALALNAQFAPAREGLSRVQEKIRAQAFESALAQAEAALAAGRVDDAEALYQRAATLGGDTRVRQGQERIAQIRRSDLNARDHARGAELEEQEKWNESLEHYRTVLARDDDLGFAIDGLARSSRRAELDRELQDYLDRSERLTAPAVRAAAQRALARGEATTGTTLRLASQLGQLKARLDALEEKVRVDISSDNSTVVFVAPVGELGSFEHRELQLAPGRYTVIGRREGFRDVRRELNIAPGQQQAAVTVQCTERI